MRGFSGVFSWREELIPELLINVVLNIRHRGDGLAYITYGLSREAYRRANRNIFPAEKVEELPLHYVSGRIVVGDNGEPYGVLFSARKASVLPSVSKRGPNTPMVKGPEAKALL
jgi:hypothetical protein